MAKYLRKEVAIRHSKLQKIHPFTGATGGCGTLKQGNKPGKKIWNVGNRTQAKRGLANGEGRPPRHLCSSPN